MRTHENTSYNIYRSMTVKDIVLNNFKTVEIMEKYGIDFCCKGKKEITKALDEKNIDRESFFQELDNVYLTNSNNVERFETWDLIFLSQYIVNNHHTYVKEAIPRILTHTNKVANRHGEKYPFLHEVNDLFVKVANEMTLHMDKEEKILFPLVKYIVDCKKFNERPKNQGYGSIKAPIMKMEQEHDLAGELLSKIRNVTHNFNLPEDACTTFYITYQELDEFEKDLHKHVHLENNILFPQAIKIEEELLKV